MPTSAPNRSLELSQRLYRRLLAAYPRRHRQKYGGAMAQLFRDQCRDAWAEARTLGLLALWLRTLPDLVKTSLLERFSNLNPGKFMSDKLASLLRPRHSPMFTFFAVFTVVFLLIFIASVAITFIMPESYASTCRIKVESTGGMGIAPLSGASTNAFPYDELSIRTTIEIMQSQMVLNNVVNKLDFNVKWGKRYYNGETLKTAVTMELLKRRLDLRPVRNSQLIAITAYSEDKKEAAQVANAVAQSYQDYRESLRRELAAAGQRGLEAQLNESDKKVMHGQTQFEALRQKYNIVDNPAVEHQADFVHASNSKPTPENQPYFEAKRDLNQLMDFQKLLTAKISTEKLESELPTASLVQIADPARPGDYPVKPNKPLNIVVGAILGLFLGGVCGSLAAFIAQRLGRRSSKPAVG